MTAREVKPLTPTTGVKIIEEIWAAPEIWPSLNGVADATETGVPLIGALGTMVGAFESAGMDDAMLTLAGTPTTGIVDRPGMTADVGKPDGDVSTGPGTLKPELMTLPLSVVEVSMAGDAGTLGDDVSTGPGITETSLLRISLTEAEVSGLEEKP